MCEDKNSCNWYDRKGWKEANVGDIEGFGTESQFLEAFMKYHLFGATSLECPCCYHYVDPDGDCGNCGWNNVMLRNGMI